MFPSVAFRPVRLLATSLVLTVVAVAIASLLGHPMVGVFFGVGLLLGLLNALGVQRSVAAITAEEHPLKKKMAVNSATRLLFITVDRTGCRIRFPTRRAGRGIRACALPGLAGVVDCAAGFEEAAYRAGRQW